jgi:polar amino acid transport system substrate-binding protein
MSGTFRVVASFLAAFCLLGAAESNPSSPSAIRARGILKVAVFVDMPPFGYIDESGANAGYDVLFAKRLAKGLLGSEEKIEFIPVDSAERIETLESGKADVLLANFTVTAERKKRVDYASPYFKTALGVVSNENDFIKNLGELSGKTLILIRGTTADTYFSEKRRDIKTIKFDRVSEAFEALKQGKGDALAHDNTFLLAWAAKNNGYFLGVASLGPIEPLAPAVKKGNRELTAWINNEFVRMAKERFALKAFNETLAPYYGEDVSPEDVIVESAKY